MVEKNGLSFNGWEARPWPLAVNLHPTAWITTEARRVIADSIEKSPLFLTASFFAPHSPLFPPKEFFDFYLKQELPPPAHGDWVEWNKLSTKGDANGHRVLLEGETLRAAQAGYFGLIEHFDREIGPLISEFKARSIRAGRPWVIIVTSDHGEGLGDHGFFRKCEPYEGESNIPMIIAGSESLGFKPARLNYEPVCLEDLMPTILELAGVPRPSPMDGIALENLLRGDNRPPRDSSTSNTRSVIAGNKPSMP